MDIAVRLRTAYSCTILAVTLFSPDIRRNGYLLYMARPRTPKPVASPTDLQTCGFRFFLDLNLRLLTYLHASLRLPIHTFPSGPIDHYGLSLPASSTDLRV